MPWHCPACSNVIQHTPDEKTPRVGVFYRCHVCRLGLRYRPESEKLIVVPDDAAPPNTRRPNQRKK